MSKRQSDMLDVLRDMERVATVEEIWLHCKETATITGVVFERHEVAPLLSSMRSSPTYSSRVINPSRGRWGLAGSQVRAAPRVGERKPASHGSDRHTPKQIRALAVYAKMAAYIADKEGLSKSELSEVIGKFSGAVTGMPNFNKHKRDTDNWNPTVVDPVIRRASSDR